MTTPPQTIVRRIFILLMTVVVLAWVAIAFGVYGLQWRGLRTTSWGRFTPLPAASLGWHLVSVHSWLTQYQAVTAYNDQLTRTSPTVFPIHTAGDNAQQAMTKVIRDAGLVQILTNFHLKVSTADIDQAFQAQLTQTGNQDQIAQTIKQLYHWTPEQFKQHVLRTVVARDRIQEKLSFDAQLNAPSRQQADRVLALVTSGSQSFQDLAKKYSDDAYGASGGDLGFVTPGSQAKAIDDAAAALSVDQVSDVVHTKYGFHILKVLERKTVDGQEQTHLLQIFIAAPSVDQYLTAWLQTHQVRVWLPGLSWDEHQGQVTTGG